jgi:hypothetical protein
MENENNKSSVEDILKELGRKIDILIEDAKGASDDIKGDIEEKIQDLKGRKESLENDFKTFTSNNEGKWSEIKTHLNTAGEALKMAAEAAFKK